MPNAASMGGTVNLTSFFLLTAVISLFPFFSFDWKSWKHYHWSFYFDIWANGNAKHMWYSPIHCSQSLPNYCMTASAAEKPGNVKKVAVQDLCCSSTDQSYTESALPSLIIHACSTVLRNFGAFFFFQRWTLKMALSCNDNLLSTVNRLCRFVCAFLGFSRLKTITKFICRHL